METIKLPAQQIEATFAAAQANRDERTVPIHFYTGSKVLQFSFSKGVHELQMAMDPGAIRLGAMQSGRAPFTMGHSDPNNPAAVLGVISNPRIENGVGVADVRFSKRPDVEPIYQDVLDGILANVSVEAALHKLKETTKEGDRMRSFVATDWEPLAVALVAQGADPNARIAASAENAQECEIEFTEQGSQPEKEQSMESTTTVNIDEAKLAAQTAERTRVMEITKIATLGKLDATFAAEHVGSGTSVEEFRRLAFEKLAARSEANATREHHSEIVADERDKTRLAATQVLDRMFDSKASVDPANDLRGMSLSRLAEEVHFRATGKRIANKAEVATLSMHQTSDFPGILENSARKQMLARYAVANPTYKLWTKPSTTPDFKTMSRLRLSETPSFLKVNEGAKITLGTMSESKETYAIATYGRGVAFTRQMLINDDLQAFNDLLSAFGIQAARLENQTVYAILTANANMSDSVALFHASHSNLGSGVIGNTALDAMFTAMGTQKGLDAKTILNLEPQFLIVPKAKEATAKAAMTAVGPSVKTADQNWFAGRLQVVADGVLDASDTAAWYGACDPSIAPGIEYAHLEGAEGPQFIQALNEDGVLGISFRAFLDFGAKAVDWRALYKSSGS